MSGKSLFCAGVVAASLAMFGSSEQVVLIASARAAADESSDRRFAPKVPLPDAQYRIDRLQASAAAGNGFAMAVLGYVYSQGLNVPRDDVRAVNLLRRGAERGIAFAQLQLGVMSLGYGKPRDGVESLRWLKQAIENVGIWEKAGAVELHRDGIISDAELAHTLKSVESSIARTEGIARALIAEIYLVGIDVPPDSKTAVQWLQPAVNAGVPEAEYMFARMLRYGWGVERSADKATEYARRCSDRGALACDTLQARFLWDEPPTPERRAAIVRLLEKASRGGHSDATVDLGNFAQSAYTSPPDFALAAKRYEEGRTAGNPRGAHNLAILHWYGRGVPVDLLKAAKLLEEAATANLTIAMRMLGDLYALRESSFRDINVAYRWWERAAAVNDSRAMVEIGWAEHRGDRSGKPNYAEARKWFVRAAALDDSGAMYGLGLHSLHGQGVPVDYVEAVRWYRRSAELGYLDAMVSMGNRYASGQGVDKDNAEMLRWYEKAASLGSIDGALSLARIYWNGSGVPVDKVKAEGILSQCIDRFKHAPCMYSRGIYYKGDVARKGEAVEWIRRAADAGYAKAQAELANVFERGELAPRDFAAAFQWYEKAVASGDGDAMVGLGNMYLGARHVARDAERAITYFERASAIGHAEGMAKLAFFHMQPGPRPLDYARSRTLAEQSASLGHGEGSYVLAHLHLYGLGVPVDRSKAFGLARESALRQGHQASQAGKLLFAELVLAGAGEPTDHDEVRRLLHELAENNNVSAQYLLGKEYLRDRLVRPDPSAARRWLERAALGNHVRAQFELGAMLLAGSYGAPDFDAGLRWSTMAADKGHASAQYNVGYAHFMGQGVAKNLEESAKWMERAAKSKDRKATAHLAWVLETGQGVKIDPARALEQYQVAAEMGEPRAMVRLAQAYQRGDLGLFPNPGRAQFWSDRARGATAAR
jgi:uncharacterized protein